jgi:transcription-repair coupling factor (superfamily II helicase)
MDIRGFGNVIGEEQSGHIKEVGIELYQHMLEEAVEAAKRRHTVEGMDATELLEDKERWSPQIKLGLPVLIPEDYVTDLSLRMGLYKRVASLQTDDDIEGFAAEIIDRFGPIPDSFQNLLETVRLKQLCYQAEIEKLDVGPKGVVLSFYQNKFSNPEALLNYIGKRPHTLKLRGDQKVVLMKQWSDAKERVEGLRKSLDEFAKLATGNSA